MTNSIAYKGTVASEKRLKMAHKVGDMFVVTAEGKYAGKTCQSGDFLIATTERKKRKTVKNSDWSVVGVSNMV